MVTLKGTMKHLIKSKNPSSLGISEYNRIILNSATDGVIAKRAEYVDLGLPSGLKWAKCNVGAEKETDYGYYFQWGETEPHDADTPYDWVNYKYCNGTGNTLTKYCTNSKYGTVDNKTTLDPEDDAATQIMGSNWRMPTLDDLQELYDNTNRAPTQVNGVKGWKFTSKKDTSKYIFLPLAGNYESTGLESVDFAVGIWSSTLHTMYSSLARYLSGSDALYTSSGGTRSHGYPVRGVL